MNAVRFQNPNGVCFRSLTSPIEDLLSVRGRRRGRPQVDWIPDRFSENAQKIAPKSECRASWGLCFGAGPLN